jgi:predicted nucleic acid-binding protein
LDGLGIVLTHPRAEELLTTEVTLGEVQEYAADLARRKRLPVDSVLMAVAALPVVVVPRKVYAAAIPRAEARIGKRDPDDVDVLALALHLNLPVWSVVCL